MIIPARSPVNLSPEQLEDMFADPFYCVSQVPDAYAMHHDTMVSQEVWIAAAEKAIEMNGATKFLQSLLKNLQGKGSHWRSTTK